MTDLAALNAEMDTSKLKTSHALPTHVLSTILWKQSVSNATRITKTESP